MQESFRENYCGACSIRTHTLFRHLDENEYEEILNDKITESYRRGSVIYQEGQKMRGFYCVHSGIIKIFKTGPDGKEQIIRFAREGDIIGYRSVLSNEPACSSTEVLEDCVVCHVSAQKLFKLVKENGNFALELLRLVCKELGEANSYITDIAQKTVRERLAEILILLEEEFGRDANGALKLTLTREEMANIVGTATESVIRLLSDFKSEKLIEINGRKIKILDNPGLKLIGNI